MDVVLGMDIDSEDPVEAATLFMQTVLAGTCELWLTVDRQDGSRVSNVMIQPHDWGKRKIVAELS